MVESDPEWFDTDGRQFPKIKGILAKDPGVNTLIEIDSTLHRDPSTLQLRVPNKPQVTNLRYDFLKARGRNNVVVHQDQIFFGAVELVDALHDRGDRSDIPLRSF